MTLQRTLAILALLGGSMACSRSRNDPAPAPAPPTPAFVSTVTATVSATAETTEPVDVTALNLAGLEAEDETAFNALLGI